MLNFAKPSAATLMSADGMQMDGVSKSNFQCKGSES
jgi:hypothetical protein